jgi:hypothetical protein
LGFDLRAPEPCRERHVGQNSRTPMRLRRTSERLGASRDERDAGDVRRRSLRRRTVDEARGEAAQHRGGGSARAGETASR